MTTINYTNGAVSLKAGGHRFLGYRGEFEWMVGAYLPGGFIDTRDVDAAGRVDIRASVLREVEEETGMATRDLAARDGFLVTFTGQQISIAVEILADAPARELVGRCGARIAADPGSELEDILAVRTRGDLEALAMPDYARLLLGEMLPVSHL